MAKKEMPVSAGGKMQMREGFREESKWKGKLKLEKKPNNGGGEKRNRV